MNIKELSQLTKIKEMHLKKIIEYSFSSSLNEEDIEKLMFLSKFWGKKKWIKMQISKLSFADRNELIEKHSFNKIESYIYSRVKNALQENKKITAKQILKELSLYYKIDKKQTVSLKKTIKKMKNRLRYHFLKNR